MPLSKRARIEIYLPKANEGAYTRLRGAFETEFLNTFGGCSVILGVQGLYVDSDGTCESDQIDLIYADMPFEIDVNFGVISEYAEILRKIVLNTTPEESVLVVVHEIYHSR